MIDVNKQWEEMLAAFKKGRSVVLERTPDGRISFSKDLTEKLVRGSEKGALLELVEKNHAIIVFDCNLILATAKRK